jgi:hypothetical protein
MIFLRGELRMGIFHGLRTPARPNWMRWDLAALLNSFPASRRGTMADTATDKGQVTRDWRVEVVRNGCRTSIATYVNSCGVSELPHSRGQRSQAPSKSVTEAASDPHGALSALDGQSHRAHPLVLISQNSER